MPIETQDGQIMLPGNAAAEEVRRRREENADLDEQMRVLRERQLQNSETIGQLASLAIWVPSGETTTDETQSEEAIVATHSTPEENDPTADNRDQYQPPPATQPSEGEEFNDDGFEVTP